MKDQKLRKIVSLLLLLLLLSEFGGSPHNTLALLTPRG